MVEDKKVLIIREKGIDRDFDNWIAEERQKDINRRPMPLEMIVEDVDKVELSSLRERIQTDATIVWIMIFLTGLSDETKLKELRDFPVPLSIHGKTELIKMSTDHPYQLRLSDD